MLEGVDTTPSDAGTIWRRCNNAEMSGHSDGLDRRRFLAVCSVAGLGQGLLPGVLWGMAAQTSTTAETAGAGVDHDHLAAITPEMIDAAAAIAAVKLTAEQKTMVLEGLKQQRESVLVIRSMKIPNRWLRPLSSIRFRRG